mgnify:FL=1
MPLQKLQDFSNKLFCGSLSIKGKILASISLIWILLVGYLIWWNGIKNPGHDKSFQWDEWIWFGIIPAIVPYIFYFIWKKQE